MTEVILENQDNPLTSQVTPRSRNTSHPSVNPDIFLTAKLIAPSKHLPYPKNTLEKCLKSEVSPHLTSTAIHS
jgi:hypothetical protein